MINEERVREMHHMAVYDQSEDRLARQVNEYYRGDYIGKELLKSFFSGTIAFLLICLLFLFGIGDEVLESLNSVDYVQLGTRVVILYAVFEIIYLMITAGVYRIRYHNGRAKLKKYYKHLKTVNRMYSREEKLKV